MSALLNGTVTQGIALSPVETSRDGRLLVQVACGITTQDRDARDIEVTLGEKPPTMFLSIFYTLVADEERQYLTVDSSHFGIFLKEGRRGLLAHWDYDRAPQNNYPPAHVQVAGTSEVFAEMSRLARDKLNLKCPDRELRDLHFPVGGRRYRPSLEDVIEFLVIEGLVESRPKADEVIQKSRAGWEERQLRAAVRRNPEAAIKQLEDDGFVVTKKP